MIAARAISIDRAPEWSLDEAGQRRRLRLLAAASAALFVCAMETADADEPHGARNASLHQASHVGDGRLRLDVARLRSAPGRGEAPAWMVSDPGTGLALRGYDPVSYFDEGVPRLGDPRYEFIYHGAVFRFATEAHLAMFMADPDHFAPALGGYDAHALTTGEFRAADPEDWRIIDDHLYLGFKAGFGPDDAPEVVRLADQKWRAVETHYRASFFQAHQTDFRDCGAGGACGPRR